MFIYFEKIKMSNRLKSISSIITSCFYIEIISNLLKSNQEYTIPLYQSPRIINDVDSNTNDDVLCLSESFRSWCEDNDIISVVRGFPSGDNPYRTNYEMFGVDDLTFYHLYKYNDFDLMFENSDQLALFKLTWL